MATPSQPPEDVIKAPVSVPDTASETASSKTDAVAEPEKFQPGWRFLAAFGSLCIITLMAALDATSISVALPVSPHYLKDPVVAG